MIRDAKVKAAELGADNLQRIAKLNAQHVAVAGINESYVIALLEHLVGADVALVKLKHEQRLAIQLDAIESNLRRQRLVAGPMGNGA